MWRVALYSRNTGRCLQVFSTFATESAARTYRAELAARVRTTKLTHLVVEVVP